MLEKLKKLVGKNKLKIVGHKNPDFDSIASGIILERFLRANDIDAHFVCEGIFDVHAISALKHLGIDVSLFFEEIHNSDLLFLVDHHSSECGNTVVGCIDHHPTETSVGFPIYVNIPSSSCALSVFRLAQSEGMLFSREDVRLVFMSIYMDTRSCKSTKFVPSDSEWMREVTEKYSFEDEIYVFEQMGYCLNDMSASLDELSASDLKEYTFCNKRVCISHIQTFLNGRAEETIDKVCSYIEAKRRDTGIEMWILMVSNPRREMTSVIRMDANGRCRTEYDKLLSRGIEVVPAIEKELQI